MTFRERLLRYGISGGVDNVVANAGAGGATFATDDIGGTHYPITKEGWGPLDTINLVDDATGKRLPVKVGQELPAGTQNIGDVDVLTLPAIPAGTNNIGDVDVLTLPAIPAGANNIGDVDVLTLPAGSVAAATAKTADYDTGAGTDTVVMMGVALPGAGGAVAGGTSSAPVRVDPTGTTTQPVSGTVTSDVGTGTRPISAASLPLPTGASTEATLATRLSESDFDTKAGSLTETAPATDTASSGLNGRLQRIAQRLTSLIALLPAALVGGRLDVNLGAAPATVAAQGDVAHDGADSGNPVKLGLQARTTDATAVASVDRVNAIGDTLGKAVVLVGAVNDLHIDGKGTFTTTTAADLIAAQAAGVRIAIMSVLVTNAHATVATKVEIRDGTTVKLQGQAAAAGGGFSHNGGAHPLFISTAATAITGRCVTTGADVDIFVSGYTYKP